MRTLASRVVYRNPWMSVREDDVEWADGSRGIYGVVDKPDFALVIPYDDGNVWLVEQYRYPVRRRAWEFPQGSWGAGSGSPEELARAELAEEVGLRARSIERLGHLFGASGFCSQGFDVFLARGLIAGEPAREATEQDMQQRVVALSDVPRLVADGSIVDAASIAAYALLGMRLPRFR